MRIEAFGFPNQVRLSAFAGRSSAFLARVDSDTWTRTATTVREAGGRLISLWGAEETAGAFVISALTIRVPRQAVEQVDAVAATAG